MALMSLNFQGGYEATGEDVRAGSDVSRLKKLQAPPSSACFEMWKHVDRQRESEVQVSSMINISEEEADETKSVGSVERNEQKENMTPTISR